MTVHLVPRPPLSMPIVSTGLLSSSAAGIRRVPTCAVVQAVAVVAMHSDETPADTTGRHLPTTNQDLVMYHSWMTVY